MHASEDTRELPEEEGKKGSIQGDIEISGGKNQGKTDLSGKIQYNTNSGFSEPSWVTDRGKEGRETLNAKRERDKVEAEKNRQRNEIQKKTQQPKKETDHYVNIGMSAIEDGAAYLKQLQALSKSQGQARPAR
jgi:hypothetical protein